jgi:hypothetical protein
MASGYSPNQQQMNKSNQYNFNNSFEQSNMLIPQPNFKNTNNLIHNNVGDNVFNEYNIDFTLHVDSADRDLSGYPSPYNFVVSLGGAGTNKDKVYNSRTNTFQTISYKGVWNPRIERNFKNIKCVSLDKVFLPKYIVYTIQTDVCGNETYVGSVVTSNYYRYLVVRIKELDNNRLFSTNTNVRDDSFVIFKDKDLGGCSGEIWIASPCRRQYLKSALKNLDKLSIEIVDPAGNPVVPLYDDDSEEYKEVRTSDLLLPQFQIILQFTIQVYENEINTQVNYR